MRLAAEPVTFGVSPCRPATSSTICFVVDSSQVVGWAAATSRCEPSAASTVMTDSLPACSWTTPMATISPENTSEVDASPSASATDSSLPMLSFVKSSPSISS